MDGFYDVSFFVQRDSAAENDAMSKLYDTLRSKNNISVTATGVGMLAIGDTNGKISIMTSQDLEGITVDAFTGGGDPTVCQMRIVKTPAVGGGQTRTALIAIGKDGPTPDVPYVIKV